MNLACLVKTSVQPRKHSLYPGSGPTQPTVPRGPSAPVAQLSPSSPAKGFQAWIINRSFACPAPGSLRSLCLLSLHLPMTVTAREHSGVCWEERSSPSGCHLPTTNSWDLGLSIYRARLIPASGLFSELESAGVSIATHRADTSCPPYLPSLCQP